MSGPSRNDPCPCGSGRKYKRCCGASGPAKSGITEAHRESALKQLVRFSMRDEFEDARALAETMFWGPHAEGFSAEDLREIVSSQMVVANFQNFVTFDLLVEDDKTMVDLFLERRGRSLSSGERRYLESMAASHVGLYEIIEVLRGEGLRLRNLWTESEELWVVERAASRTLTCWDVLATRLVRQPSGDYGMEGDLYPFPAHFKQKILTQLEKDHEAAESEGHSISPVALLKRFSFRYHGLWLEALGPKTRELGTFDGKPLVPSTHHYAIESPAGLVRALDACEELREDAADRWVYLREWNGAWHLVGELRIEGSELTVAVMCDAHGQDVRALLQRIAGGAVRYVHTEDQKATELLDQGVLELPKESVEGDPEDPLPAASLALVKRALDQHYRRWLDDEIPALGGSTPRAAAADDKLRPRLIELLKEMENREQRHPSGPGGAYDFGWLRRELGLGRGAGRARPGYPQLYADLGHYLDNGVFTDRIPREARHIGLYLGRIVAAASSEVAATEISTGIDCRRRPGNTACGGVLLVSRAEPDDRLHWTCPRCGDGGTIEGWKGTPFDLSMRPAIDGQENSAGVVRQTRVDAAELRRLLRLPNLTGPALTLLVSARREEGGTLLRGSRDEFVSLAQCVALEVARRDGPESATDKLIDLHILLCWTVEQDSHLTFPSLAAELIINEAARSPRLARLPASGAPDGGHRVRVQLLDIEPPIWRLLELPSRMPLADLHSVLVLAMGWANYHLHVFEHGERRLGLPHPEDHVEVEDSRTVLLGELLPREGDSLVYEYDFGDCWRHEIRVESISASPPERPRLLDGARACPPEDCGGAPGHERLLAALGDSHHPDHEELSDWAGVDFDPEVFHLREHDLLLERLDVAWQGAMTSTTQRT